GRAHGPTAHRRTGCRTVECVPTYRPAARNSDNSPRPSGTVPGYGRGQVRGSEEALMPKLPRNMVKRGRSFQFRQVVNGRMVRRSLGTDYQEACRRLRSLKTDSPPLNRITLEEAADRWLKSYVPTVRGEKGQKLAAQRVRDYINRFAGHLLLGRLSAGDCRALRLWLEKKTLSIQSVRHILSDVRCLLNWCEDSGLIDRSPFPRRILPKIQERPPDRLTDE